MQRRTNICNSIDIISVICAGIQGCDNMDIHTPIHVNHDHISNINITTITTSTHIYSIHGLSALDIYCDGDCDENNDAYIIYGVFYEYICPIYDLLCVKSTRINTIAFQSDDDLDIKYNSDSDYANLILNENRILLFLLHPLNNITSITSICTISNVHSCNLRRMLIIRPVISTSILLHPL